MTKPQEVQETLKKKDVDQTPSGRYKCPLCPRDYKTFHGVKRHYLHKHQTDKPEPVGRPTKYDPKYIHQMIKYFGAELVQKVDTEFTTYVGKGKKKDQKIVTKTEYQPRELPTFEMFAQKIGVYYFTLKRWAAPENKEKYPGFCEAYEHCKKLQKDFLIQNSLLNRYNAHFAKFVAINITDDMVDRKVTEHTGKGGDAIQLDVSNEKVNKVLDVFSKALEEVYEPKESTVRGQEDPGTE